MILARGKNGQIGRMIPGQGLQAKVQSASMGERRGNVYLSNESIKEDQAYWDKQENETRAYRQAQAVANIVKRKASELKAQEREAQNRQFQQIAKYDPMNAKLKAFYARQGMMGEDQRVSQSVAPADFSSSGANPQYVDGVPMTGGNQWRADYRQHLIVGNPLTRDGVYGPAVTDYDRFVQGIDVNQTDVVAGGTMLGRYDGQIAPAGNGRRSLARPHMNGAMGFDWSWGGLLNTVGNTINQTVDNLVDKLPDQLTKELEEVVWAGGSPPPGPSGGGTVYVNRPVQGAVNTVSQTIGLPPWAIYTGVGLLGVGVLFIVVKALK